MTVTDTTAGRIVAALLTRASSEDWPDIRPANLATDAGLSLVDLRKIAPTKSALLDLLVAHVDEQVMARAARELSPEDTDRDRLFDVVMMRFETLQPSRSAIKRIADTAGPQFGLVERLVKSQRWMLETAGLAADGTLGTVRTLGLSAVYADVFRVWLKDEDAGMAKTMARLDRQLRRSERLYRNMRDVGSLLGPLFRRRRRPSSDRRNGKGDGARNGSVASPDTPDTYQV